MTIIKFFHMIVVLVHILIFGYTKFHQHDVYCTPSTKKLSTALFILCEGVGERGEGKEGTVD